MAITSRINRLNYAIAVDNNDAEERCSGKSLLLMNNVPPNKSVIKNVN